MNLVHYVGYSKSARTKCYGPEPCRGSSLPIGTLRYGLTMPGNVGESVEWRHWGCVTPDILETISAVPLDSLLGYAELRPEDQQEIRHTIENRHANIWDASQTTRPVTVSRRSTNTQLSRGVAIPPPLNNNQILSQTASPTRTSRTLSTKVLGKRKTEESRPAGSSQNPIVLDGNLENAEEPCERMYCELSTQVVGIQYYHGLVGVGEQVVLTRQPDNPYDGNAIQVTNISWVQVGHLPRNVAAKLSPLVDRGMVTVEGVMQTGNLTGRKGYQLQIQVNIYGAAYKRDELEPLLIWATPGQRGFKKEMHGNIPGQFNTTLLQYVATTQLAATPLTQSNDTNQVREILSTLENISDEDRRSSLLENLCSNVDFLNLPLHPQPPGTKRGNLTIDLLRHQSQALQWAIEREYPRLPVKESDPPVQFWKLCKNVNASYYYNIVTRTPQEAPPILGRGALYADAMGMGKTLTMIALILATKDDIPKDFSNTTLIVVPLSVLSNWEKQIHDHCAPRALSCFAYYGTNRNILSSELTTYDIVLTTYQTVMNQFVPEKRSAKRAKVDLEKSLFDIRWKRIILDEGHTIRNPETTTTHAVCSLAVQRRWVLTGTPIINSPKDLGSLLGFLKTCSPLDNGDLFKRLLLRPLRVGDPAGAELLRALMSQICIRRTKEMQDNQGNPLVPLPPVDITVVRIMLEEKTKKIYDEVERISRRRFEDALHNKSNPVIHANVLSMLTRMRQLALHPDLIPKNYLEELRCGTQGHFPETAVALGIEEKGQLIQILLKALEDCEECPICFNILNEPRITRCHHSFCLSCISEMISRDPWCPLDRRPLLWEDLIGSLPAPETMQPLFYNKESTTIESSAKIDQLIRLINLQPINEKSLVFSQFTSFLDKIAIFLEKEGIPHVQFDGSLSSRRRVEVLNRFSTPLVEGNGENVTNPKVMLISLKSGALGLNLTVANNVYLMDPWWQEGIESQAIDRVNRIGQKNPVHVFQMIADGTVESKVMEIQARKKKLINQAFSGMKTRENERQKKEARIQDLVELFGIR